MVKMLRRGAIAGVACGACALALGAVLLRAGPARYPASAAASGPEHEQDLATIEPLTARMAGIAWDGREQRLDARPQFVVNLPRLRSALPRLGWLAPLFGQ